MTFEGDSRSLSRVRAFCVAVDWDSPVMCKALWSYQAQMQCDLTFSAGENANMVITVKDCIVPCSQIIRRGCDGGLWTGLTDV